MPGFKDANYGDRLSDAQSAKKALLEKFHSKPEADDPSVLERKAAREVVLAARAVREAKRVAERKEQARRDAIELAAREEAERRAQAEREEAERLAAIAFEKEREEMLEAEAEREVVKKAERDARYAARKARKKGLVPNR